MTSQPVEPRRALYDEGGPGRHRVERDRAATWYRFEPVYYHLYQKLKQNVFYSAFCAVVEPEHCGHISA
jgi:hypothetical protein